MITISVEIRTGCSTRTIKVNAPSIRRALELAAEGGVAGRASGGPLPHRPGRVLRGTEGRPRPPRRPGELRRGVLRGLRAAHRARRRASVEDQRAAPAHVRPANAADGRLLTALAPVRAPLADEGARARGAPSTPRDTRPRKGNP